MKPGKHFRNNLAKALINKNISKDAFAKSVGMSTSKIQRLSNPAESGSIDLNDACLISEELGTTVGYMTGSVLTDKGIAAVNLFSEYFNEMESNRKQVEQTIQKYAHLEIPEKMKALVKSIDFKN